VLLGRDGEAGDADAVTEKLEALATGLQELRPKAEALAAAANVRARSGAKERATALLADAAKAARAIDGSANKTFALLAVARATKAATAPASRPWSAPHRARRDAAAPRPSPERPPAGAGRTTTPSPRVSSFPWRLS
jgi:hypothetical protein